MLIHNFKETLLQLNIKGVIHIGAHNCEEKAFYNSIGINDIFWIDANAKHDNIHNYLVSDSDGEEYTFNISNNTESSSIYDMKLHLIEYPYITYDNSIKIKSNTIDTIYTLNNIDKKIYNMWNICVQGAELKALQGGINNINNINVIFTKVYNKELYNNFYTAYDIDIFLLKYNFYRVITEYTINGWGVALYVKKNVDYKYKT
uniref:Methyltransferase FkbM domain-containing protein n=1 Tax=Virus NIOZ-UU159 TaxID=2763270 RepID=A0A7S9XHF0_9VIRU|nr:MAG: hypothetical protein NIOZUU159_00013 [Virus NIOZ-UU159]|tara:strand:- start:2183 stop:2791 length:609 start_codon:yes stop_codon:yes gene_type:complete